MTPNSSQALADSMEESFVDQVIHTVFLYFVVTILFIVTMITLMKLARHVSIVSTWFAYRRLFLYKSIILSRFYLV